MTGSQQSERRSQAIQAAGDMAREWQAAEGGQLRPLNAFLMDQWSRAVLAVPPAEPQEGKRRWTLYVKPESGVPSVIEPGPTYLGKGERVEVMPVEEHEADLDSLLAERDRLREALGVAADDLDKAANQFDGLYQGILCQYVVSGAIPGTNGRRFAEKAARARAVLGEPVPEESNDG